MSTPLSGASGVGTTKGDLFVVDASGNLERLAVGANGTILRANTLEPTGLKWDTPDDIPGIGIPQFFGGTFNATSQQGRYHKVSAPPDGTNSAVLDAATQSLVLKSGRITRFGWSTNNADATTVYKVWKNGIVLVTFNLTGATGVSVGSFGTVAQGDVLAVEYDAGTPPSTSQVKIFIE